MKMSRLAVLEEALAGSPFMQKYELTNFISSGTFGQVWECTERITGRLYAVKIISKLNIRMEAELQALRTEFELLTSLQGKHAGLVNLKDAMESENSVQFVMELCAGGDLYDLIAKNGPLPEASAKLLFEQVASALKFLHSRGIIHRDIKPENIFLNKPAASLYSRHWSNAAEQIQAKLGDFGLSAVVRPGERTAGFRGSESYTAPEVLLGRSYGRRIDVWSLGIVLSVMLTGRIPLAHAAPRKACRKGPRGAIPKLTVDFTHPCWQGVSAEAKGLVSRMLLSDPAMRLRSSEILSQPWFNADRNHTSNQLPVLGQLAQEHPASTQKDSPQELPLPRPRSGNAASSPQVSPSTVAESKCGRSGSKEWPHAKMELDGRKRSPSESLASSLTTMTVEDRCGSNAVSPCKDGPASKHHGGEHQTLRHVDSFSDEEEVNHHLVSERHRPKLKSAEHSPWKALRLPWMHRGSPLMNLRH